LGLELQGHPVPHVVNEVFEAEELQGAQGAPVTPVNANFQLSALVEVNAKSTNKINQTVLSHELYVKRWSFCSVRK
jgi:hypothetical protein